jgi:hypothetical protein
MNMCLSSLAGPSSCVEEMRAPATSWQSQMFMGKVGVSCLCLRALSFTKHVVSDPVLALCKICTSILRYVTGDCTLGSPWSAL